MDMWNKTNYGAQVEHMKNAGLNPALMYKGSGAVEQQEAKEVEVQVWEVVVKVK
jgi:hypothetical protein